MNRNISNQSSKKRSYHVSVSSDRQDAGYAVRFSDKGLMELLWSEAGEYLDLPELLEQEGALGRKVRRFLRLFSAGKFREAEALGDEIPIDLRGTSFQKAVWLEIKKIPAGQVLSYSELGRRIGKPKATRAVGNACGANPLFPLIPCHRVVASNNKLGGFSGNLNLKRELLKKEGVLLTSWDRKPRNKEVSPSQLSVGCLLMNLLMSKFMSTV